MRAPLIVVDPQREESELRAYLGAEFDLRRLRNYQEQLDAEFEHVGDEERLYRMSQAYLYNLTAFAMTLTKQPYLDLLAATTPVAARVLDMGCGIGSDGLALLEAGYDVSFADFDNPSTRYLRWRLQRRGLRAPIYDLDRDDLPSDFDLAYAFDVIEHVDDPFAFVERMERHAGRVLVNLLEPDPDDTVLHRDLPIAALVRRATGRRLERYERWHSGRSHVLLYGRGPARGLRRIRSLAQAVAGIVRPRR